MTSPSGDYIIAVNCHTVDGQDNLKAAGKTSQRRIQYKAQCATNIIQQVVRHRLQGHASASSQGHYFAGERAKPSIIIAGDLNVGPTALKTQLGSVDIDEDTDMVGTNVGNLFCLSDCQTTISKGLPQLRGPDKQHLVGVFDVSVATTCQWSVQNLPPGVKASDVARNHAVGKQTQKAQQSSSRGSGYSRCRRAMAMIAAMMATLVDQGRSWPTWVDFG